MNNNYFVVQFVVALFLCSKKVLSLTPCPYSFVCSLCACSGSMRALWPPPTGKKVAVWLIGLSKQSLVISVCALFAL